MRHALVIGNARYEHVAPLVNPRNDARAMHASLTNLGYDVDIIEDASVEQMRAAVHAFGRRVQPGDTAVVYYSGHGVSVGGTNYLLPVDFNAVCDQSLGPSLAAEAVSMTWLLQELESHEGRNVFFFDACRNNPCMVQAATRSVGPSHSIASSFTGVHTTADAFIAFASAEGETADDGVAGIHSPFTAALLRFIATPRDVRLLIGDVRNAVRESTGGRQTPWVHEALRAPLILSVPADAEEPPQSTAHETRPTPTVGTITMRPLPATQTLAPSVESRLIESRPAEPLGGGPPRYIPDPGWSQQPFWDRLFFAAVPMRESESTVAVQSASSQWAEIEVDSVPITVFGNGHRVEATIGQRHITLVPPRAPGYGILQLRSSGAHRLTVSCFDLQEGIRLIEAGRTELTFDPQNGPVRIPCN